MVLVLKRNIVLLGGDWAPLHQHRQPASYSPPPPPPLGESLWQTGQHSPSGMNIFSQNTSSHWISSQRTWPLSQTQIRHGSGFQMSLFVYTWPSAVQLMSSPGPQREGTLLVFHQATLKTPVEICGVTKQGPFEEMLIHKLKIKWQNIYVFEHFSHTYSHRVWGFFFHKLTNATSRQWK